MKPTVEFYRCGMCGNVTDRPSEFSNHPTICASCYLQLIDWVELRKARDKRKDQWERLYEGSKINAYYESLMRQWQKKIDDAMMNSFLYGSAPYPTKPTFRLNSEAGSDRSGFQAYLRELNKKKEDQK